MQAAGLGILFVATMPWHVTLFAFFFGAGFGGSYPARSAMVAERFGTKAFGQINGVIAFLLTLIAALGLLTVGAVTSRTSSYESALAVVGVGSLIAVGAILSLEAFSPMLTSELVAASD